MKIQFAPLGRKATLLSVAAIAISVFSAHAETADRASDFLDSVGINVHFQSGGSYSDKTNIKQKLQQMKIRHVRDGLDAYNFPWIHFKDLYENYGGIQTTLTLGYTRTPDKTDAKPMLKIIRDDIGPDAIAAIEGVNEPNLFHSGTNWERDTEVWQKSIWNTVKNDSAYSALANHVIVGPSLGGTNLTSAANSLHAEFPDAASYMDFGNIHPYPGGWEPDTSRASFMGADLDSSIAIGQTVSGSLPLWATETGYRVSSSSSPAPKNSPTVAGVYLPRLFFYYWNRGIPRTFVYQLFEQNEQYGLYASDGTTIRPAGRALNNMISLLDDDDSASFTPQDLDFSLSNSNVQKTLVQKSNGEFWMALWLKTSYWPGCCYGYGSHPEVNPPDQSCTITFNQPINAVDSHTNLEASSLSTQSYGAASSVTLTVSERVTLVRIVPTPGAGQPALLQASDANGLVVTEAENADGNISANGHTWEQQPYSSASGELMMVANPDSGLAVDSGYVGNSPKLSFRVNFTQTGTHCIWLRGRADYSLPGNGDSVHVGLDGAAVSTSDRMGGWGNGEWTWEKETMDGPRATIYVPSAGIHTVDVWMREDGFRLDKLIVAKSSSYTPSGSGPAESQRIGAAASFVIQAEDYDRITSPMSVYADASADGGEIVSVASGNNSHNSAPNPGWVEYDFTLSESSEVGIWMRMRADTGSSIGANDSFWVDVTGDSSGMFKWNGAVSSTNWAWKKWATKTLPAGTRTLRIAYREDGTLLDSVFITTDGSAP